jgi:replication-associated recombination protein RarA
MNITKMSDLACNTPKRTMLYGSPGSGKTSIAMPNDYTDVWTPQSLRELLNELSSVNVREYDVIVIDTLGDWLSY